MNKNERINEAEAVAMLEIIQEQLSATEEELIRVTHNVGALNNKLQQVMTMLIKDGAHAGR